MLVLSLFPGIGLFDMAFEREGFCVVRGPDVLWGGDIRQFAPPPGKFDGVIGGPPCQLFSPLQKLVAYNRAKAQAIDPDTKAHKEAENLIPEFERCVTMAEPRWFVMENVTGAPEPSVTGYVVQAIVLNNRWCGGEQNRVRRFCFGWRGEDAPQFAVPGEVFEPIDYHPAVTASGGTWDPTRRDGRGGVYGDKSTRYLNEAISAQGLPDDYLKDAPLTVRGKLRAVGNGVPLPMGQAVAASVRAICERQAG